MQPRSDSRNPGKTGRRKSTAFGQRGPHSLPFAFAFILASFSEARRGSTRLHPDHTQVRRAVPSGYVERRQQHSVEAATLRLSAVRESRYASRPCTGVRLMASDLWVSVASMPKVFSPSTCPRLRNHAGNVLFPELVYVFRGDPPRSSHHAPRILRDDAGRLVVHEDAGHG